MPRVSAWSGDTWSEEFVVDTEMDELVSFIGRRREVYIYGKGKIGTGIGEYFRQSRIPFAGYVTSEDFGQLMERYREGDTGIVIGVSDKNYAEIREKLRAVAETDIFLLTSEKREMLGKLFSLDIAKQNFHIICYVVNTCNLNCRSCSTFAPICKPDYYTLEQLEKDLTQIVSLDIPIIRVFKFTGGEPFLHPQLTALFRCAREKLPDVPMECYTNGLLLGSCPEDILREIASLGITLVITEYPVQGLDLEAAYRRLDSCGVNYNVIYSDDEKKFFKRPLNLNKDTPRHMFYYCPRYRCCSSLILNNGRLYKCMYQLVTKYFNEHFGTDFEDREGDYLDIYHTNTDELYQYIVTKAPFCDYCSPVTELITWERSGKRMEEWV